MSCDFFGLCDISYKRLGNQPLVAVVNNGDYLTR